jgi:hypothetical protein
MLLITSNRISFGGGKQCEQEPMQPFLREMRHDLS